ncbi:hypothetical protein BN1723_013723 [Verticillium longisporum]|uniref:Uncharacterized protein n=1 Tax=Verticillium longisporum TaxID=100787 RepID=A0A0G4LUW8_VERLO|nr:hypothetical protein BN1723_013723 [Verticillium longisporum]
MYSPISGAESNEYELRAPGEVPRQVFSAPKQAGLLAKWSVFGTLLITTTLSTVLVIIAVLLGLIHASAVAYLVQYGVSLAFFGGTSFTTHSLRAMINTSTQRANWKGPPRYMLPVLGMSVLSLISSGVWVGAITPVESSTVVKQTVLIPSYDNTTHIKEYPSEINQSGPSDMAKEGHFTYSVGTKLLGNLIVIGSSATTPDNSTRRHPKIDNTQYIYEGRSYGVGSAVGLKDSAVSNISFATGYRYTERGYSADVECIYNRSTALRIGREFPSRIFAVEGYLPDSTGSRQYSEYVGHSPDAIVAASVTYSDDSIRRYVGIAAGESYRALNATQCTVDFTPRIKLLRSRPPYSYLTDDFDPPRNITRTVVRQFELISNDLTNFYESVLGNAFLSSIRAWNISYNANGAATEEFATLRGLENSVTAMADSMLAAYGAAQVMVGNFTEEREVDITVETLVIGQRAYIIAVAILNALTVAAVIEEAIRTKGWRGLSSQDFTDSEWLLLSGYRGGQEAAESERYRLHHLNNIQRKPVSKPGFSTSQFSPGEVRVGMGLETRVVMVPATGGRDGRMAVKLSTRVK